MRLLEHYQLPAYPTPHLLGVDDFALRRGQVYATVDNHFLLEFVDNCVKITSCEIYTTNWYYPDCSQKGFVGSCTYTLTGDKYWCTQLSALANFARYAGVGCKSTMGMGQIR